jgi:hypothetical protein
MMMYEQQQDWRSSTGFLKNFYHHDESSEGMNPSILKAWTVFLALGFCGAQFDGDSRNNVDESVLQWWEVVDLGKLLQLDSQKHRGQVLGFLSQCLLGGEDPAFITKVQMDQVASEMWVKWLEAKYG